MALRLKPKSYARQRPKPPRIWLWSEVGAYEGLFLPEETRAEAWPELFAFIEHIAALYSTPVGMVVMFNQAIDLDPKSLGRAYALRAHVLGGWMTYPDAPVPSKGAIEYFHHGQRHRLMRTEWSSIDLLSLWNLEKVRFAQTEAFPERPRRPVVSPKIAKAIPVLKEVVDSGPALGREKDRLGAIKPSVNLEVVDTGRRLGLWVFRAVFTGVVLCLVLAVAITLAGGLIEMSTSGGNGYVNILIVILIFCFLFWALWPGRARVSTDGKPAASSSGRTAQSPPVSKQPRRPGLLSKLNGWLIWNTPAGDRLRRGLQRRVAEMEKLISMGEIDEALKRALSAATSDKKPPAMASRLPDIRSNLDLNFGQSRGSASIPMSDSSFLHMREIYRKLASDCEAKKDFGRAAFIYDELLDETHSAIRVLEEAERYEDAAKLAMARDQSGGDIVRLWYLAGKRDIAIALAERYNCFETLVQAAENKSREAGLFIRKIWAERLVQTGDYRNALQVSDTIPGFDEVRLQWLAQAIGLGELDTPEIFHRAVLLLPWREGVLNESSAIDPQTVGGAVEARLRALLEREECRSDRGALLDYLCLEKDKSPSAKALLQKPNVSLLCEHVLRKVIADGVPLTKKSLSNYGKLARLAQLDVLAADLKHIRRDLPKHPPEETAVPLPAPQPGQPNWCHVVCLPQGRVLVADDVGTVRILQPNGNIEWSDHVSELAGFVRVRNGRYVMFILGSASAARRIVRLDTLRHEYTPLGLLPLEAWHHETNESLWMVKSKERIQALSVSALFSETPEFTENWGVTIKERVKMLGFIHNDHVIGWYMQRHEGAQAFGLIEYWNAPSATLSFSTYLIEPPNQRTADRVSIYSDQTAVRGMIYIVSGPKAGLHVYNPLHLYSWDFETSLKSEHFHFLKNLTEPAPMRSYGSGPVVSESESGLIPAVRVKKRESQAEVSLEKCKWLASDYTPDRRQCAVIDEAHRVVLIDLSTHDVRIIS